jgi:hypothetical protein
MTNYAHSLLVESAIFGYNLETIFIFENVSGDVFYLITFQECIRLHFTDYIALQVVDCGCVPGLVFEYLAGGIKGPKAVSKGPLMQPALSYSL